MSFIPKYHIAVLIIHFDYYRIIIINDISTYIIITFNLKKMKEKESKCKNPYIYRYDLIMAREATTAQ